MKTKRKYAPSTRTTERWHKEEMEQIEKGMKKLKMKTKSDYIRHKVLK